jgi:hypothetical protein
MPKTLTKNHVYCKSICAVGIMRRSNFGQLSLGVKEFAPKDNWVTSKIYFIYMTGCLGILPTSQALNQVISSKIEPTMRFGESVTPSEKL